MCSNMNARTVVAALGGPAAVARALKSSRRQGHISTAAVSKWTRIPTDRCPQIVALSGGRFALQDLRPDIFGKPQRRKAA